MVTDAAVFALQWRDVVIYVADVGASVAAFYGNAAVEWFVGELAEWAAVPHSFN
jgi:hypothetical protein